MRTQAEEFEKGDTQVLSQHLGCHRGQPDIALVVGGWDWPLLRARSSVRSADPSVLRSHQARLKRSPPPSCPMAALWAEGCDAWGKGEAAAWLRGPPGPFLQSPLGKTGAEAFPGKPVPMPSGPAAASASIKSPY